MRPDYIGEYNRLILPSTIDSSENKVLIRAKGVWVYDSDGKKYLDAASQVSMANIGHNHPKLIRWMGQFLKASSKGRVISSAIATDCYYKNVLDIDGEKMEFSPVALEKRLAKRVFGEYQSVAFFDVTGAQGVDDAIRYFRTVTGKPSWIAFEKAFHGRHGESRDSSDSNPVHWDEAPRNPNVYFLPYPETKQSFDECVEGLNNIPLSDCATVVYEPVQGEGGGMRVGHYLKDLEQILKKEGVYSISDEIQAGMGRCGEWFGYQRLGLKPDAIVAGKALGTILPVSAFVVKEAIHEKSVFPKGKISGTFPMYALGMAAANFVMRIYEEEDLVGRVRKLSPIFNMGLEESISRYLPYVKADGLGFYRSIKFYDKDGNPDAGRRDKVQLKLRDLGIWTYTASKAYPAIRFTPPLVSTEADLKFLTDSIHESTTG